MWTLRPPSPEQTPQACTTSRMPPISTRPSLNGWSRGRIRLRKMGLGLHPFNLLRYLDFSDLPMNRLHVTSSASHICVRSDMIDTSRSPS